MAWCMIMPALLALVSDEALVMSFWRMGFWMVVWFMFILLLCYFVTVNVCEERDECQPSLRRFGCVLRAVFNTCIFNTCTSIKCKIIYFKYYIRVICYKMRVIRIYAKVQIWDFRMYLANCFITK